MSRLHPNKYRYIVNRLDQDWRVVDKIDARIIGAFKSRQIARDAARQMNAGQASIDATPQPAQLA
jgi:hypothetical protein